MVYDDISWLRRSVWRKSHNPIGKTTISSLPPVKFTLYSTDLYALKSCKKPCDDLKGCRGKNEIRVC